MKYLIALSAMTFVISGTASAKEKNETTITIMEDKMAGKQDMGDPTRMICEKQAVTGSRLGAKRICATAAEWDAIKRQERQTTESVQKNRATVTHPADALVN